MIKEINGDLTHDLLIANKKPKYRYESGAYSKEYCARLRKKFNALLGIDKIKKNACPENFNIEFTEKKDGYTLTRFTFDSEVGSTVPCYLLIPDTGKKKYPVAITLQGHSSGFHNSIGVVKYEDDKRYADGRGAFALQAVKHGYIALAIEQRAMGERLTTTEGRREGVACSFNALSAFLLGRTIIGERCYDVSKAIDALKHFEECDLNKITIVGESGGGTASYYAAAYDKRIRLCVSVCAFCTFDKSITYTFHCPCNFIPDAFNYFDMQDVSPLIAPRKLTVVAGKVDPIFLIDGAIKGFETVKAVYKDAGAEDSAKLIVTPKGHWWCEDIIWNAIDEEVKKW